MAYTEHPTISISRHRSIWTLIPNPKFIHTILKTQNVITAGEMVAVGVSAVLQIERCCGWGEGRRVGRLTWAAILDNIRIEEMEGKDSKTYRQNERWYLRW